MNIPMVTKLTVKLHFKCDDVECSPSSNFTNNFCINSQTKTERFENNAQKTDIWTISTKNQADLIVTQLLTKK